MVSSAPAPAFRDTSGAHLDWRPEPTVSVVGSDHVVRTVIELNQTATCGVVEEVVLGRTDERSGRLALDVRIERGGTAVVHHHEEFGPGVPGAGSVVSVGDAHRVWSGALVGVDAGASRVVIDPTRSVRVAWLPVATDAAVVLATAVDRPPLPAVHALVPELGAHRPRPSPR